MSQAVKELNASKLNDVGQLRGAQLKRIVAEFKDASPPYSSFDPVMRARAAADQERLANRREYMRKLMRKQRATC